MHPSLAQVTSYVFFVFPAGFHTNRAREFYKHSELAKIVTHVLENNENYWLDLACKSATNFTPKSFQFISTCNWNRSSVFLCCRPLCIFYDNFMAPFPAHASWMLEWLLCKYKCRAVFPNLSRFMAPFQRHSTSMAPAPLTKKIHLS